MMLLKISIVINAEITFIAQKNKITNRNPFIITKLILGMISIKIHKTYRDVIAICDAELLGKNFEEGNFQLNLKESFYKGENIDEKKAIQIIQNQSREDATFNIVGEKSISCALKAGITNKQGIKKIQGIPYSLVLM